jgi:hypothetical protein
MSAARHLFTKKTQLASKLRRRHAYKPRKRCHDGSVTQIKNSNSGNRMAGAMKEGPGTMGSVAALAARPRAEVTFLAAQKDTQPVKAVDRKNRHSFLPLPSWVTPSPSIHGLNRVLEHAPVALAHFFQPQS